MRLEGKSFQGQTNRRNVVFRPSRPPYFLRFFFATDVALVICSATLLFWGDQLSDLARDATEVPGASPSNWPGSVIERKTARRSNLARSCWRLPSARRAHRSYRISRVNRDRATPSPPKPDQLRGILF